MRRESLNGFEELTGIDRRQIKKRLAGLTPIKEGRSHLYQTAEALPLLYLNEGGAYKTEVERARLLYHQANIAALDEQVKEKTLLPAEMVLARWQDIAANVRARLLSIPPQLATTCVNQPREEIEEKATALIRHVLEELASGTEY